MKPDWLDFVFLLGLGAVLHGVAMIHEPSAWILGGLTLMGFGVRAKS